MLTREQILESLQRRGGQSSPEASPQQAPLTKAQILQSLERRGIRPPVEPEQSKEGFLHRAGQVARGIASGIGGQIDFVGNFPQTLPGMDEFTQGLHERINPGTPYKKPEPSKFEKEIPEAIGLGKYYEPEEGDTLGKTLQTTGEMLSPVPFVPFGGYGAVAAGAKLGLKSAAKALGKEVLSAGSAATAMEAIPNVFDEGTALGAAETLGKGVLGGMGANLALHAGARHLAKKTGETFLTPEENQMGNYLKDIIGEEHVPGVTERLKNAPEYSIGYQPMTSEVAGDPTFSQLQRSKMGGLQNEVAHREMQQEASIRDALRDAAPQESRMQHVQEEVARKRTGLEGDVERTLREEFPVKADAGDAGRAIQEGLESELETRRTARREPSQPLYDAVEEMTEELNPVNTKRHLSKKVVAGKLKDDLDWVAKQIKSDVKLSPEEKAYRRQYAEGLEEAKQYGPEAVKQYKKQIEAPKSNHPSIAKLSAARAAITARIEELQAKGARSRVKVLSDARTALTKDLEHVEMEKEARAIYKKLSPPVNEIEDHNTLKRLVAKDNKEFKVTEARVPKIIMGNAEGTVDDAKALMKVLGKNKEAMDTIKAHLNKKAVAFIVDPNTGLVDEKKLEIFRTNNPGVATIYPELMNSKLENVKNAQAMANRFYHATEPINSTLEKDAFGKYVGKNPKKALDNLLSGDSYEKMKNLVDEIGGNEFAMNGLRREILNFFDTKITTTYGIKPSAAQVKKFIGTHRKALGVVLTEPQIKILEEIDSISKGQVDIIKLGQSTGSHTTPLKENLKKMSEDLSLMPGSGTWQKFSKFGNKTPWIGKLFENAEKSRKLRLEAVLQRAILDPKYAEALLSKSYKSKEQFLKAFPVRHISPLIQKTLREYHKES